MLASQRGFLFLLFAGLTYFLYLTWEQDQSAKLQQATLASQQAMAPASVLDTPAELPAAVVSNSDVPAAPGAEPVPAAADSHDRYVELRSDVLRVVIDRVGGDVVEADLLKYRETQAEDSKPIRLLQQSAGRVYVAGSGIAGVGAPDSQSPRISYALSNKSADSVTLSWQNDKGVSFSKTFSLLPGQHVVSLVQTVNNTGSESFTGRAFQQFKRDRHAETGGAMGMSAYTGAAFGTADKRYEKYTFEDMDEAPLKETSTRGWVAMLQHYFVAAWVPAPSSAVDISSVVSADKHIIIRAQPASFTVAPGQQAEQAATLYLGPKIQDDLAKIAEGLDLTVDYGFLWWIGQPLFWALTFFYGLVGNWGVAIILVTIAVKLLMYPIANAQFRSFARMRQIAPKLQALKERHGDDRQAFSQAMMELYKKEKVNPLGGCLPLLITMPVFMALYWVLMESVELRHSSFIFWIKDLAVMDPYFVLPVLMGVSMWFMQKLQPPSPTMDPMQQKMFQYLPVIMSVFFLWFPAGLVLYWLVNNLLTIAQQTWVNHSMAQEATRKS